VKLLKAIVVLLLVVINMHAKIEVVAMPEPSAMPELLLAGIGCGMALRVLVRRTGQGKSAASEKGERFRALPPS
jgi:hypothetical protein